MFIEILSCHQICLDVVCVSAYVSPVSAVYVRSRRASASLPLFLFPAFCILHASSSVRRSKEEERLVSLSSLVACRDLLATITSTTR